MIPVGQKDDRSTGGIVRKEMKSMREKEDLLSANVDYLRGGRTG